MSLKDKNARKEYQKKYHKQWYLIHKTERYIQKKSRLKAISTWLKEMKATLKCIHCPENNPVCLDFHHRDPKLKKFSIGTAVVHGYSIDEVLKEIEKCDVLCKNCHAKEHAKGS